MNTITTSPPRRTIVSPGADLRFLAGHPSEPGTGVLVGEQLGSADGSVHMSVAHVRFEPGAAVQGHLHPFEESFFVMDGELLLTLGSQRFALRPGDFGLVPIGTGHAWSNASGGPAQLLRLHCPQPRPMGGAAPFGVYSAPEVDVPADGAPVDELDPRHGLVGHFDDADMPPPAAILMPGYHGSNIRNVSIRMMVDELLGARHHTLFVVEFTPSAQPTLSAKEHFHPFEEMYYFLSGHASGSFDGERVPIAPGDLLFAAVGASHGFTAVGDSPVRWIEAQAPLPPASNGFFFHADWAKLEPLG